MEGGNESLNYPNITVNGTASGLAGKIYAKGVDFSDADSKSPSYMPV
jgi:hypothetical protein